MPGRHFPVSFLPCVQLLLLNLLSTISAAGHDLRLLAFPFLIPGFLSCFVLVGAFNTIATSIYSPPPRINAATQHSTASFATTDAHTHARTYSLPDSSLCPLFQPESILKLPLWSLGLINLQDRPSWPLRYAIFQCPPLLCFFRAITQAPAIWRAHD